jgi:hypothetical protein
MDFYEADIGTMNLYGYYDSAMTSMGIFNYYGRNSGFADAMCGPSLLYISKTTKNFLPFWVFSALFRLPKS